MKKTQEEAEISEKKGGRSVEADEENPHIGNFFKL